jgi:LPXTG-motif cell wall-anchored protein
VDSMTNDRNSAALMWIGIGAGVAIGLAIALGRRKQDRWSGARNVSKRVADRTNELAIASKDMLDRLKIIFNESQKVVEDASELWEHGRKLVGV